MNPPLVHCSKCNAALMEGVFNQPEFMPCPACDAPLQIEIFPALFRRITPGSTGETIMVEGEASCFYHPQKKALLPCDGCGRFLCALCDCVLDRQHYCPTCLEAGRTKGKIKNLQNSRVLYDSIALAVAVLPIAVIFGIYFTFITAPMALFFAIRYWNAPLSITRRTKARYILAIVLAVIQIALWTWAIYALFTR